MKHIQITARDKKVLIERTIDTFLLDFAWERRTLML